MAFSSATSSGTMMQQLYPLALASVARDMPVDPTVPSKIQEPVLGMRRPLYSASLMICRATRSFGLPPGLRYSALPRISQPVRSDRLAMRISGVFPISPSMPGTIEPLRLSSMGLKSEPGSSVGRRRGARRRTLRRQYVATQYLCSLAKASAPRPVARPTTKPKHHRGPRPRCISAWMRSTVVGMVGKQKDARAPSRTNHTRRQAKVGQERL